MESTNPFWITLALTLKLASFTTFGLLLLGIPLAYYLAYTKNPLKPILEAIVSLPLVLPPTVLGFYFLVFFSPQGTVGSWLDSTFSLRLIFSFEGLVVASMLFSLPFMVHPLQSGFSAIPKSYLEAAWTLGKGKVNTLFYVLLPNMKSSLLTGVVLAFAHTVGEFGVVLMMGGNIPGETRVASIAIYDELEALNYPLAHQYALTLFLFSFVILLIVYLLNRRFNRGTLP